jgi:hypothetical protein
MALKTRLEALFVVFLAGLLTAGDAGGQLGVVGSYRLDGSSSFGLDESGELGWATAVGDFNGDGLDDLAIGVPGGTYRAGLEARIAPKGLVGGGGGFVAVYLGSPGGLVLDRWLEPFTTPDSRYGFSLAAGDFDGNGTDDLAIGIPAQIVNGVDNAGAVRIHYTPFGGADAYHPAPADGLFAAPVTAIEARSGVFPLDTITQLTLAETPEAGDLFGFSLAAGDLSGDGVDDLAIGVPVEGVATVLGEAEAAGAVHVVYGALGYGLSAFGRQYLHEETPNVTLNANDDELFGFSLLIAQLAGGPIADLAVGIPGELTDAATAGGSVMVFAGADGGLDPLLEEIVYRQGTDGLLGTPGDGDDFGYALTSGDFDGDGYPDLAIGVPGEDDLGTELGAVQVLYGGPVGLATFGNQYFVESVIGGGAGLDDFDRFGTALGSGDFDADGDDELVIGAPFDNSLGVSNAGEITVLQGSPTGLSTLGHQIFDMLFFGGLVVGDRFGYSLAAGHFDPTSAEHLAVGVPWLEVNEVSDAGGVVVIRSRVLFADGFESGDASMWSATAP